MQTKSALTSLAVLASMALPALAAGQNSTHLFPTYHLRPPANWINDPCGPYFDPDTKEFHLFYQYNPEGVEWGNITWGHYTSKDMGTWTDRGIALRPGPANYDKLHVFSGSTVSRGYKGLPTIYYTAVNHNPIGWRLPFVRGAESQAIAYTEDHGKTWKKAEDLNPLLGGDAAPAGNLTGWRDPFVFRSPAIDRAVGNTGNDTSYMIVSGGKQQSDSQPDFGPSLFLYKSNDHVSWTDAATKEPFLHFGGNVTFRDQPADIAGSFGYNFELTNFETISDDWENEWNVVVAGTEGGRGAFDLHWPMWIAGDVGTSESGTPKLIPKAAGVGDWGSYYAQNGFIDPVSKKWIVWGWSNEDDGPLPHIDRENRGWAGLLSVPREQHVVSIGGLQESAAKEIAAASGIWTAQQNPKNGADWRVATLGVRPAAPFGSLRGETLYSAQNASLASGAFTRADGSPLATTVADISLRLANPPSGSQKAGLTILRSPSTTEQTVIYYDAATSQIVADRSASSLLAAPSKTVMKGSLILLPGEPLDLRVLVDGSVVEVFANGRFAMTVRVYPTSADSALVGAFVDGEGMSADVEVVAVKSVHESAAAGGDAANSTVVTPVVSAAPAATQGLMWGLWAAAGAAVAGWV